MCLVFTDQKLTQSLGLGSLVRSKIWPHEEVWAIQLAFRPTSSFGSLKSDENWQHACPLDQSTLSHPLLWS
ncbi:hypothetical protein Ae201684P_022479 [Aphanomyces euteiches]|nr:hypothetical protein Ae201684P_022479 [Aphanomyces euteiches]